MRRFLSFAAPALFLICSSSHALAQSASDRATARSLAYEGQAAFDKADYQMAEDRFSRADSLVHAPTLLLALARTQVKLGKMVQAYESYQSIIREGLSPKASKVFKQAYADAEKEVGQISPRLGWVTLVIKGPDDPKVVIDQDTEVPRAALNVKRAVNPGDHEVTATASGFLPNKAKFSVGEGEAIAVTVTLERDPNAKSAESQAQTSAGGSVQSKPGLPAEAGEQGAPRGKTQKILGFVSIGVGGAGLIAGGVTGYLAMNKKSKLDDACQGGQCPPSQQKNLDAFHTFGTVSTIAFIVGGVGVATGVTLLLTTPHEKAPSVAAVVGPGSIHMRVSF